MKGIAIVSALASVLLSGGAEAGGSTPVPKAGGVWDDSTKPVPGTQKQNPKGGIFDDSTKPASHEQKPNPKGGVFDDSTKPGPRPSR